MKKLFIDLDIQKFAGNKYIISTSHTTAGDNMYINIENENTFLSQVENIGTYLFYYYEWIGQKGYEPFIQEITYPDNSKIQLQTPSRSSESTTYKVWDSNGDLIINEIIEYPYTGYTTFSSFGIEVENPDLSDLGVTLTVVVGESEIALTSSEHYFNMAEALRILTDSNDKYTPNQITNTIENLPNGDTMSF